MWLLLAILPVAILLGGMSMTASRTSVPVLGTSERVRLEAGTMATLFALYREAVNGYAEAYPGYSGSVPVSSLSLPPGTIVPGAFGNRVSGGIAWSWIAPSPSVVYAPDAVMGPEFARSFGSLLVGVNKNGVFESPSGISLSVSVPPFVPNGSIVSFWEV